jgi:hypothetical protein
MLAITVFSKSLPSVSQVIYFDEVEWTFLGDKKKVKANWQASICASVDIDVCLPTGCLPANWTKHLHGVGRQVSVDVSTEATVYRGSPATVYRGSPTGRNIYTGGRQAGVDVSSITSGVDVSDIYTGVDVSDARPHCARSYWGGVTGRRYWGHPGSIVTLRRRNVYQVLL